jgi:DNA-directed RNA polymerase beta subunit
MIYNILNENQKFIHINNHSVSQLIDQAKIFLNGEWIGMTSNPFDLYNDLRLLKQNGFILRTNGIIYDIPKGEIKIYTDGGRLYRPLLNVKDNTIILTDKIIDSVLRDNNLKNLNRWDALIEKYPETIDFVDMEEQFYMLVSEYKDKVIENKINLFWFPAYRHESFCYTLTLAMQTNLPIIAYDSGSFKERLQFYNYPYKIHINEYTTFNLHNDILNFWNDLKNNNLVKPKKSTIIYDIIDYKLLYSKL